MKFGNDNYGYSQLENDLKMLEKLFGINTETIGKSVLGKNLYVIKIGHGKKNVFYNGAHHSLEWITAPLLVRFAYDILNYSINNKRLMTFNINDLLEKTCIHIVPMVNPDGVELVLNNKTDNAKLIEWNKSTDFATRWQSNINGVDLNHNYDANFEMSRKFEQQLGITGPSNTRYAGPYPESEPETKAICDYVRSIDFELTMALHSQGEVIYYDYNGKIPKGSYEIAKMMSKSSGYMLDKTEGIASFGGFKDWFIDKFDKAGYTIEVGHGKNPIGFYQFNEIYEKILGMMIISPLLC